MELQEAIASRRSIKKFKHDMTIDDDKLYQAIEKVADAPNHGMREPWRIIHIAKDRLGEMSRDVTHFAFPNHPEKQEDHYNNVTNLGGMLVLVLKLTQDNDKIVKTFCNGCVCSKLNVAIT